MGDPANNVLEPPNFVTKLAREPAPRSPNAPAVATIVAATPTGVLIDLDGRQLEARVAVADPVEDAIGREALVDFIDADPERPVITGLLRAPRPTSPTPSNEVLELDADRLRLIARRELVLRCGKGSIRLTHDGRVVIDGVQLVSRAEGANRIRGGTIHLN